MSVESLPLGDPPHRGRRYPDRLGQRGAAGPGDRRRRMSVRTGLALAAEGPATLGVRQLRVRYARQRGWRRSAGNNFVHRAVGRGLCRIDVPVSFEAYRGGADSGDKFCVILRITIWQVAPLRRLDNALTAPRQVADLAPLAPPTGARPARGPLNAVGGFDELLAPGREPSAPTSEAALRQPVGDRVDVAYAARRLDGPSVELRRSRGRWQPAKRQMTTCSRVTRSTRTRSSEPASERSGRPCGRADRNAGEESNAATARARRERPPACSTMSRPAAHDSAPTRPRRMHSRVGRTEPTARHRRKPLRTPPPRARGGPRPALLALPPP